MSSQPVPAQQTSFPPRPARVEAVIVDFNMPFGSMVLFIIKWAIAAIPAIIILSIIWVVVVAILATMFAGVGAGLMGHRRIF